MSEGFVPTSSPLKLVAGGNHLCKNWHMQWYAYAYIFNQSSGFRNCYKTIWPKVCTSFSDPKWHLVTWMQVTWMQPASPSQVRHKITQANVHTRTSWPRTLRLREVERLATRLWWMCGREESTSVMVQQSLSDSCYILCNLLNCCEDDKNDHIHSSMLQNFLEYLLKMQILNFIPHCRRDLDSGFHGSLLWAPMKTNMSFCCLL